MYVVDFQLNNVNLFTSAKRRTEIMAYLFTLFKLNCNCLVFNAGQRTPFQLSKRVYDVFGLITNLAQLLKICMYVLH